MSDLPMRHVGKPPPYAAFYWSEGSSGKLHIASCNACDRLHHPPGPVCPYCYSADLAPRAVSGLGTVAAYTVNHQPFVPGFDPPYVFAFVEIDEDPVIRLSTNIVGCEPGDVHIGMRVEVEFEENDGNFVPLFHPTS